MSELLQLANQLRGLTNDELERLVIRRPSASAAHDFFDLAQALLQPKSIEAALARLSVHEVDELWEILQGSKSNPSANSDLITLCLASQSGTLFEPVLKVARDLLKQRPSMALEAGPTPSETDLGRLDPLASIAAFEAVQALTELVLDIEQHRVRVIGKNGAGLADHKRLANHLRKSTDFAKVCFELAIGMQLIGKFQDAWWLTPSAHQWVRSSVSERWLLLAKTWVAALGDKSLAELRLLTQSNPNLSLKLSLNRIYPLADKILGNQMSNLASQAETLGLSVQNKPSNLLLTALNGDWDSVTESLEEHLPKTQEEIIVQADLSLITPGPLPTETELLLRTFAQVEQVSIASTYRLSALSLSHGMESGLSSQQIRETLVRLNKKPLPQPVEYLISEAENRFGRLTLTTGKDAESKCLVSSTDKLLLTEILNDVRLKPFAIYPFSAGSLATRFDSEVMYLGLRELGFVPIRKNSSGQVISPRIVKDVKGEVGESAQGLDVVGRLRLADERIGSEPDDTDLLRQIQLALKNKTRLNVTLTTRDASEVTFEILPTSLANGRLRGLDHKADTERTLPLERIVRVGF